MTARDLAGRLHARSTGPGRWQARCPAHPDRSPSLGITEGRADRVLLLCRAGCPTAAVLDAAGLLWRDILGAPGTAADRARLRRERDQRQGAEAAERKHAGAVAAAADAAQVHAAALAARLAALEFGASTPAYPGEGDVLAEQYHIEMRTFRELEAA